jgi:type I restriction enzyme S subunit
MIESAKEWKKVSLGEISRISSGGTPSRKINKYWNGEIPWVKTALIHKRIIEKEHIDEWITEEGIQNSSAKIIPKNSIIMAMYGQGKTRGMVAKLGLDASINQACAAIEAKPNISVDFVFQYLLQKYDFIRGLSNSGGQKNLSSAIIKKIKISLPPLPEQRAIADILATWDEAIETLETLIEAKEKRFYWLITEMIHHSNFDRTKIKEFIDEISLRNNNLSNRVLSVTNHSGFVLPEKQFSKKVASDDLSNYKVVRKGQFAYNPSRINVGSIARLDEWDIGVLSPMYTVFKLDSEKIDTNYFSYWLQTHEAKLRIKNSAQGSVRETVSFDDLGSILIPLPKIGVQQKISEKLKITETEIEILKRVQSRLIIQKRGLMQKLLTGEWRVKV